MALRRAKRARTTENDSTAPGKQLVFLSDGSGAAWDTYKLDPKVRLPAPRPAADGRVHKLPLDTNLPSLEATSTAVGPDVDHLDDFFARCDIRPDEAYTEDMLIGDMGPSVKKTPTSTETRASLDPNSPPVSSIERIFDTIAKKLEGLRFQSACTPFRGSGLRVVTMCSGTESPLLAMKMLQDAFRRRGILPFEFYHLASAEIEPFKQAYIQRNFQPPILFRDVTDFCRNDGLRFTAYGGTAKDPTDVDLLIAGSSCVDYSLLNNRPLKFGERGESFDTLAGIAAFAKTSEPAVIILENVHTAPWDRIREYFANGGYFCIPMGLDSKDFYIPQTRTRGYMIAFNKLKASKIGLNLEKAARAALNTIMRLGQRASSPYTEFIFRDDDSELQKARRTLSRVERGARDEKNLDWSACRQRYIGFRVEKNIGFGKPFTNWLSTGNCTFPDYAWVDWAKAQRERVLDTLDINFLCLAAERDYDMSYKARILELSQNVDRDMDSRHWGIVGCITPSGLPFDTRRGGPVFGKEVLALQGIPVDRLHLNNETSRQLQDLAGNAMTTTVIGCVISAAIIASHTSGGSTDRRSSMPSHTGLSMFGNPTSAEPDSSDLQLTARDLKDELTVDLSENVHRFLHLGNLDSDCKVIEDGFRSVILCMCDDTSDALPKAHYKCVECGHTACHECMGNPPHIYEKLPPQIDPVRKKPASFSKMLSNILPMMLSMRELDKDSTEYISNQFSPIPDFHVYMDGLDGKMFDYCPTWLDSADIAKLQHSVLAALQSKLYLTAVKRGRLWRVVYDSCDATLELRIEPAILKSFGRSETQMPNLGHCTWLLFAKLAEDHPAHSCIRDVLSRPIAKMVPRSSTLFNGEWQVWQPTMNSVELIVSGIDDPSPAWESKIGLQNSHFRGMKAYEKLSIEPKTVHTLEQSITNVLAQICRTYQWCQDCGTACGLLYKKIDTSMSEPMFFFLDPRPTGNAFLDRFVFARSHERLPYGVQREHLADTERSWRPVTSKLEESSGVTCRILDTWIFQPSVGFQDSSTHGKWPSSLGPQSTSVHLYTQSRQRLNTLNLAYCASDNLIMKAKFPLIDCKMVGMVLPCSEEVDVIDRPHALQELQWFTKRLPSLLPFINQRFDLPSSNAESDGCVCVPVLPLMEWHSMNDSRSKKVVFRPQENAEKATQYERQLRNRPKPVKATLRSNTDTVILSLSFNLATLLHRVTSRTMASDAHPHISWSLREYVDMTRSPNFPKLDPYANDMFLSNFVAADGALVSPRFNPAKVLHHHQCQTLKWMLQVEQKGEKWEEWNCEDVPIPAMNLVLRVQCQHKVQIHGGIVADEVGAGKTATLLALITQDTKEDISRDVKKSRNAEAFIQLRATLIVVPPKLVTQWKEEIFNFTQLKKHSVVVIRSFADLRKFSFRNMVKAHIVLVSWMVLEEDDYWQEVGDICSVPHVPKVGGRAFQQWLHKVGEDLETFGRNSKAFSDLARLGSYRNKQKHKQLARYNSFRVFTSEEEMFSHGVNDQEYSESGSARRPGTKTRSLSEDEDDIPDLQPLLHLFEFKRLVLDEFTYLEGRTLLSVLALKSTYRWLLSGTPPLTSFGAVNTMAQLIGTNIVRELEYTSNFSFLKNKLHSAVNDTTRAEQFRGMTEVDSPTWLQERNARTELFVKTFVRKSAPLALKTKTHVHWTVVHMSPLESYLYLQAYHRLMSKPLIFRGTSEKNGKKRDTGEITLESILGQANSAEEALMSAPMSLLALVQDSTDTNEDTSLLAANISGRECQLEKLVNEMHQALKEVFCLWGKRLNNEDSAQNPHLAIFLRSIVGQHFGDIAVSTFISKLISRARQDVENGQKNDTEDTSGVQPTYMLHLCNMRAGRRTPMLDDEHPIQAKFDAEYQYSPKEHEMELRVRATYLTDMTREMVDLVRQLRLSRVVQEVMANATEFSCACCERKKDTSELDVLGLCGHVACCVCIEGAGRRRQTPDQCPIEGCMAGVKGSRVSMARYLGSRVRDTPQHGSKIAAVVAQIRKILDIDDSSDGDNQSRPNKTHRILVFLQYGIVQNHLRSALAEAGIAYRDGLPKSVERTAIEKFRADAKTDYGARNHSSPRVLLLQIDSPDAAGWNLQAANHVIFVCPFLTRTQYDFEATMRQAVGRVYRHGQTRDVHSYHFAYARTIEVDILQQRFDARLVEVDAVSQPGVGMLIEGTDNKAKAKADGYVDLSGLSLDRRERP